MLSVAEVCEMQPGDDQNATWINPGFIAVVAKINHTTAKKTGKPMHICTLQDTTGNATISMTVFRPTIGFDEGDTIEVSGQGLRLTEYNGLLQATLGLKSEVHTLTAAAHPPARSAAPGQARATSRAPANDERGGNPDLEESFETAAPADKFTQTGRAEPANRAGGATHYDAKINGQTVGMAVKAAIDILLHNAEHRPPVQVAGKDGVTDKTSHLVDLPLLRENIEAIASDIIAASLRLESGKIKINLNAGEPVEY